MEPRSKSQILQIVLLITLIGATVISKINCFDDFTWYLEAFPVLIGIPLLLAIYKKWQFTNFIYILLWMHGLILLVGAHYTYAEVPLFHDIKDWLHLSRNHYDRVGHIVQGFVPAMVIREMLIRIANFPRGGWLMLTTFLAALGVAASYELLEWGVAMLTGESATAFLGTQGDVWDTQKDMFLAAIGAIAALLCLSNPHDYFLSKFEKHSTLD